MAKQNKGHKRMKGEGSWVMYDPTRELKVKAWMAYDEAKKVTTLPAYKVAEALTAARETVILSVAANKVLGKASSPSGDRAMARKVITGQAAKLKKLLDVIGWELDMEVKYAEHTEGTREGFASLISGARNTTY